MKHLIDQVENYLKSDGYSIVDHRPPFIIANKMTAGSAQDIRVVGVPAIPSEDMQIRRMEQGLLKELGILSKRYPRNARYQVVVDERSGISRDFVFELRRHDTSLLVPVQFFDAPFKTDVEAAETAIGSARKLRKKGEERNTRRAPQPYLSMNIYRDVIDEGDDLVDTLVEEIKSADTPRLWFILGPAGIGKSVLYEVLFWKVYERFLQAKTKLLSFPRPIPMIPDYLDEERERSPHLDDLFSRFIETELYARIKRETLGWMVANGYAVLMFDGLDELYSGDRMFFEDILDLMTHPDGQTRVIICAREALVSSCESYCETINEFRGSEDLVRIYRLAKWDSKSKRSLAWISLKDRLPSSADKSEPPEVLRFLEEISKTDALKEISSLPYYCWVLAEKFKRGEELNYEDDLQLLDDMIDKIIERESEKGLFPFIESDDMNDFMDILTMIGWGFYESGSAGLRVDLVKDEYAGLLPALEGFNLLQFPLFSSGSEEGTITFEHELIGEYLAGSYLFWLFKNSPDLAMEKLGDRIDLVSSVIARHFVKSILNLYRNVDVLANELRSGRLSKKGFRNCLQMLLLADPGTDIISKSRINVESMDLSHVIFSNRDLSNVSLRNCDLTNTVFDNCDLHQAMFEGAVLEDTRFENVEAGSLSGARFGNLERFEYVYVSNQLYDDHARLATWIDEQTGIKESRIKPCPAAKQLRQLFLKYVFPDGKGKRDKYEYRTLTRGRRFEGAPSPEDCVDACGKYKYLTATQKDSIVYYHRPKGDRYSEMVSFVKDWSLSEGLVQLLDVLCQGVDCIHVPGK